MKKKSFEVIQHDYAIGKKFYKTIEAKTPRGASNIMSRDHYNRFSYNVVYEIIGNEFIEVYTTRKGA